jgi:inorganic triphosphatase YgiF
VIVVFTKFDACDDEAYGALKEEGLLHDDAVKQAPSQAMKDFEKTRKDLSIFKSHYPPKAFVILRGKVCFVIVWEVT